MSSAAVGQPHPRFPIALEHMSSLKEWPRRGGRHVHVRQKSNGGVHLRRVTSGVVVRALGPAMALFTTAIANTTKNPRVAPLPYDARRVVVDKSLSMIFHLGLGALRLAASKVQSLRVITRRYKSRRR
jgi:hypothetical protein